MKKLNDFLNKLEMGKIWYRLDKIRAETILVEVAVPVERWEIEFMEDDRGCDVLEADQATIQFLYQEYQNWLLSYDLNWMAAQLE